MGRLRRPSPFGPPPRSPTRSLRGPGGALPPLRPPPPARRGGVCHLPRQRAVALPDGPVHPQAVEGAELGEDVRPPVASGDRVSGCRSGCSFKGAPQAVEGNGDGRPRRGRAVRCERVVEELVQRAGGGGSTHGVVPVRESTRRGRVGNVVGGRLDEEDACALWLEAGPTCGGERDATR